MIKKIYGKHTFYFSVLTICLSIISLLIAENFKLSNELITPLLCLFFILSIGISHGAMDNYKANKLLKIYKLNNKLIFFIIYILISFSVILLWSIYSSLTLLFFLLVASYHFGREDTSFLHKGKSMLDQLLYLVKGSLIVFSPLFFHFEETLKIFEILFLSKNILIFIAEEHWIINVCLSLNILGYFYFAFKNSFEDFEIIFLDLLSILILNYFFTPLIAFTIYFCFLHSIRHIISIAYELNPSNFLDGFKNFVKKALPLTIITAVLYLISIVFLSNSYVLNDAIIKVIFIGLASLTFPHILLEYLIEINEKRN
jgi:Brp/Blh family beta-carotene 15,15'-monooxygenase